jgi:hypothetical protein
VLAANRLDPDALFGLTDVGRDVLERIPPTAEELNPGGGGVDLARVRAQIVAVVALDGIIGLASTADNGDLRAVGSNEFDGRAAR